MLCTDTGWSQPAEEPFVLGVFPRHNYEQTIAMFLPISKQLEAALHKPVRLETAKDFPTFWVNVKNGRYQLVHYNQYHYLKSHKNPGYELVAKSEEFGRPTIASVIMVRKDSGLDSLNQLKDKTVIFGGGTKAMMSYIVPRMMLRNFGLRESDYKHTFARNPPNALMAVYFGKATACGVGESVQQMYDIPKMIDLSKLKIIARSPALTHLAWAVNRRLSMDLRIRIRAALTHMHEYPTGRQALRRAKLTRLVTTGDAEYNAHRDIIFQVLHEKL